MIRTGHLLEAMSRCESSREAGSQFWRIDLIESNPQGEQAAPQVFGLEMGPGARLGVHFHFRDQFQVVIKGSGTLGPHALAPYALHYASGHTGYGPVVAGEAGMTYLTIRALTDGKAHYLPEKRAEMLPAKRRNVHAHYELPAVGDRRKPGLHALMPMQDNGAAAWTLSLAPGESYVASEDAGMRYYFVMQGEVRAATHVVTGVGCVFLAGDNRHCPLVAGVAGADLLVLQFDTA